MIFEEDVTLTNNAELPNNAETLALLSDLNRKKPTAKYAGKIVKIEAHYGCPITEMNPSLAAIVRSAISTNNRQAKLAANTESSSTYVASDVLPKYTKIRGVEFDEDTVMLTFHIQEVGTTTVGDKIVVGNQLKSTLSKISTRDIFTEDNTRVDALFSNSGTARRIVISPIVNGISARIMEKLEQDILDMYFDKDK